MKDSYVETNVDVMGKEEDFWWPNYFIILIQLNEYFYFIISFSIKTRAKKLNTCLYV